MSPSPVETKKCKRVTINEETTTQGPHKELKGPVSLGSASTASSGLPTEPSTKGTYKDPGPNHETRRLETRVTVTLERHLGNASDGTTQPPTPSVNVRLTL